MADLTISTADLLNAAKGLDEISFTDITPRGAYALRKQRAAIVRAYRVYEETRMALATEHSHQNEDGSPKRIVTEVEGKSVAVFDLKDREAFAAALQSLQSEPVTLSGVRPVTLEELGNASISEATMTLLGPLVVDAAEQGSAGA
jgi:hypothetical protein